MSGDLTSQQEQVLGDLTSQQELKFIINSLLQTAYQLLTQQDKSNNLETIDHSIYNNNHFRILILFFPVNMELIKSLWIPNIFICNLKTFQTIDVLSKLSGLWIDARKRVYYSQATSITFICPMVFDAFPLDTQICKFQVKYQFEDNFLSCYF